MPVLAVTINLSPVKTNLGPVRSSDKIAGDGGASRAEDTQDDVKISTDDDTEDDYKGEEEEFNSWKEDRHHREVTTRPKVNQQKRQKRKELVDSYSTIPLSKPAILLQIIHVASNSGFKTEAVQLLESLAMELSQLTPEKHHAILQLFLVASP
jgi:hypothetical protein